MIRNQTSDFMRSEKTYLLIYVGTGGIEPPTSILSEWRSTTELRARSFALAILPKLRKREKCGNSSPLALPKLKLLRERRRELRALYNYKVSLSFYKQV